MTNSLELSFTISLLTSILVGSVFAISVLAIRYGFGNSLGTTIVFASLLLIGGVTVFLTTRYLLITPLLLLAIFIQRLFAPAPPMPGEDVVGLVVTAPLVVGVFLAVASIEYAVRLQLDLYPPPSVF